MHRLYPLLAVAALVLGLSLVNQYEPWTTIECRRIELWKNRNVMAAIAHHLREYHKERGRYPSNDEGLLSVRDLVQAVSKREPGLFSCWIDASGILTLWKEPFIYENRRGQTTRVFNCSAATSDTGQNYSVRVDNGIYVWSLAAKQTYDEYVRAKKRFCAGAFATLIVPVLFIVLYIRGSIRLSRSSGKRVAFGSMALSILASAIIASSVVFPLFAVCVSGGYDARLREPELDNNYRALLSEYHVHGAISDRTYQRILNGLKANPQGRVSGYY